MHDQKVLIIGEVFVESYLDIIYQDTPLVRLGGIFHSARAFSALKIEYAMAYYAPTYLEEDINYWTCILQGKGCYKLGNIENAPNVMLINESKETGKQSYTNILKDQAKYLDSNYLKNIINLFKPTDILIYPGRYDFNLLADTLKSFNGKIHIDFHYDYEVVFPVLNFPLKTAILSTSSILFKENCKGSIVKIREHFKNHEVEFFLIKENRGGSYCQNTLTGKIHEAPAYTIDTMHSVGVGDVYNAIFISSLFINDIEKKMRLASLCAAKYAGTMSFERFKNDVELIINHFEDFANLEGVRLSWLECEEKNIYLAAPDFVNVDTSPLVKLYDSLSYHNFKPHLPIQENGIVTESTNFSEEKLIYYKDINLLNKCDLLIAVILYNDPGTYIELGMFKQAGKPTIIFDPFLICSNMFAKHTPDFFCTTFDQVINATYICLRRR